MTPHYDVVLDEDVSKFLRDLDKGESKYIRNILKKRLATAPKDYGSPMTGEKYKELGIWKLNTSGWRIFYKIDEAKQRVLVAIIEKRNEGTYTRIERKLFG